MFKETFGDLEVSADFIKNYLPEEILGIIELDSLRALKDSFIEPDLRDTYSDLLFSVNIAEEESYLYFLFEHKSSKDQKVAFQLLGYIQRIWHRELEREKENSVPLVIPTVFYHGKERWSDVKGIGDWIKGYHRFSEQLQRYVPTFNFILFDFSLGGDEKVTGNPKLQAYLQLIRHIYVQDLQELFQIFAKIEHMLLEYDIDFFDTIIIYIMSYRNDVEIISFKEHLTNEGGKRMASLADRLRREGEEKGIEKGIEEGKEVKARETAKKLFLLNMDESQIKEVTGLTEDELNKIKKDLNIE